MFWKSEQKVLSVPIPVISQPPEHLLAHWQDSALIAFTAMQGQLLYDWVNWAIDYIGDERNYCEYGQKVSLEDIVTVHKASVKYFKNKES